MEVGIFPNTLVGGAVRFPEYTNSMEPITQSNLRETVIVCATAGDNIRYVTGTADQQENSCQKC